ncbi:MAG TPA: nuclear transport factor 2 family protein [Pyrinomonadaceae bacterium]|nr:nuclear transport factor 2 family protein [Pyrinomonadaceae bacterium]
MFKKLVFITLALALPASALAQNSNTKTTPSANTVKGSATNKKPESQGGTQTQQTSSGATTRTRRTTSQSSPESAVRDAFDSLVDGIRRADADAVMKLYLNSPQLSVFNNNGSVTRGWEQVRSNRQSLYAKVKDVKLDVRDVRVRMLGATAALVTCLWDQTQTADGQSEHATGRLTIVYQKIGADWKIVHTHTSPDHPSPSNLLPSETTGGTNPTAKP